LNITRQVVLPEYFVTLKKHKQIIERFYRGNFILMQNFIFLLYDKRNDVSPNGGHISLR